jgi:hypothetical protein
VPATTLFVAAQRGADLDHNEFNKHNFIVARVHFKS